MKTTKAQITSKSELERVIEFYILMARVIDMVEGRTPTNDVGTFNKQES